MGSFEWKNNSGEHEIVDLESKISHLPDCILHLILSYLPTKEAVTTSVLARRWKYLWTEVPFIDFDDSLVYSSQTDFQYPLNVTCFMNFVERVLLLRHKANVKRFRLSCRVCFSASHVHGWISAALKQNIQELDLCLLVEEPFALPWGVFNNAYLTSVNLEMNCSLQLPACISFPRLTRLHLCLVTLPNDYLMQQLLSSCPFLEDLAILDCEWINLKHIQISIPSLKSLTIDDLPFGLADDLRGCEIKIDAESLTLFKYSGYLSNEIYISNLSSSALALIHIPILHERRQEIALRTFKLFREFNNVRSLRISTSSLESLFQIDDILDRLPIFKNLTLLELRAGFSERCIGNLIELFKCFPRLQCLNFCEGLGPIKDYYNPKPVASPILSNLSIVNYSNFYGTDTEICFLKFFLDNAIILEKLNVVWSKSCSTSHSKSRLEIIDQLHSLPRGSRHCAVVIT